MNIDFNVIGDGVMVSIIGLLTVFMVLIMLWLILEIMHVVIARTASKEKAKEEPVTETHVKENVPAVAMTAAADLKPQDDSQLIAVITAAVAASLNTSTYNLRIKSLRRTDNWKKASKNEHVL